jgi:hypothetical protein
MPDDGLPKDSAPQQSEQERQAGAEAEAEKDLILVLLEKADEHLDRAEKSREAAKQKLETAATPGTTKAT